ncbi:MAG: hypothetical protein COB56_08920 [Robiginitomaculum sp.]|nr:MAG: hypothetical protein COB56_08920 [Robiginitomaculum sp.]
MSFVEDIIAKSASLPSANLAAARSVRGNPLDVFERLSVADHLDFERVSANEIHIALSGLWCEHDVSLVWNNEAQQVELYLLFDSRAPGGRSDDICRLLTLLNERLSSGHFDFWNTHNSLVYRSTLSLAGGAKLTIEQAMALLAGALEAAERGYPACQYVVWAGKTPEDALDTALLDLASHG